MTKKMKKKNKLKILPVLAFLLIVFFVAIFTKLVLDSKIRNIYIYNNNILSDQEIIELAEIENYPSFLKTSSRSIKKRLMTNNLIKDVKIKKKLINQIHIYVNEKVPLFKNQNNKIILDDKSEIDDTDTISVLTLLNYVPDTIYDNFINKLSKIDKDIRREVSEIEYKPNNYDKSRFLLYMNDGNYVYLTLTKFDALNYYNEVYATLGKNKGILYLDSGNHFKIMK